MTRRYATAIGAHLAVLLSLAANATGQVPRDAAPPKRGTAVIRGTVTERDTGAPISGIPIMLASESQKAIARHTDQQGRYEFSNLPAGEYFITADAYGARPMFLPGQHGDDSPLALGRGRPRKPLQIADGDVREKVDIALWRSLALNVRVTGADGQPLANVSVQAERVGRGGGQVGQSRQTDDRGFVRLFGFPPGSFRVCVTPRDPIEHLEDREGQVRTCYPAAVTDSEAQPVTLTSTDVDLEIHVQRSRLFAASGIVVDANGAPVERASVSVVKYDKDGASSGGSGVEMTGGGRFSVRGLAPGDYAIVANLSGDEPYRYWAGHERPSGYAPFAIGTSGVDNLVVVMQSPVTVTGRLVFEGGRPPGDLSLRIRPANDSFSRQFMMGRHAPPAPVKDDMTFQLAGLIRRNILEVDGLPRDWFVKAVKYDNRDVTIIPTEFRETKDPRMLEIVVSNRGASVTANITDDKGLPAEPRTALFIVFPADPVTWQPFSSIKIATTRDAAYRIGPLRAGDYIALAVRPGEFEHPRSKEDYEALARAGEKFTLLDAEQRVIDLRLVTLPER